MSRKPREWKPPHAARDAEPEVVESSGNVFADLNVPTPAELDHVFGGVVSPAAETPTVIETIRADEPIPPGLHDPESDEADHDWLVSPAISIRAGFIEAIANPGPWPNAERLGRAQRHMEELINALPEAIEAATGCLKEDLETLKDILA